MCGIFGIVGNKSFSSKAILEGLRTLEYRGYDSWGVAVVCNNKIVVDREVGKIGKATIDQSMTSVGIGHTRWATHGGVTKQNAHPHLDCKARVAVVHNGIIENYRLLKSGLKNTTHQFKSETDTEIIAHLIEYELDKKQEFKEAVRLSFNKLEGSNAIVVLDKYSGQLAICRNGSPLVIGLGRNASYISSDVTPFLKYTKRVIFLDDNQGAVIDSQHVSVFNVKNGRNVKYKSEIIKLKKSSINKGKFPHFLIKEIYDQNRTIGQLNSINIKELEKIIHLIQNGYRVVITGCGTAAYCAMAAKYFFASYNIPVDVYSAYEFAPFADFINDKTLFVAISQSGETADTLLAVKTAKKRGAHIVAIVNAESSTLGRLANTVIAVSAGPEIAVVSTKAFTAQLTFLYLLAGGVAKKLNKTHQEIKNLDIALNKWLNPKLEAEVRKIAKIIAKQKSIYLIGKNLSFTAALETALKIKEVSYIHAEAFASGELKHGPIALIEPGTICLCLLENNEVTREVLLSCAELISRGAIIIGVSPLKSEEFDFYLPVPDLAELTIIAQVVIGQLLGYYCSVELKNDPDKPRNLAKSVTVK